MRNHPANAAARVRLVAVIPRDEVDVQVRHRLASRCAIVDADVVAIGPVLLGNQFLGPVQKIKQRRGSTSVASKNEPTWRFGITRLWPGDTG